jgi:hypothetical protein
MAKKERLPTPRVNFFSGQRVTEADLDAEQIHNLTVSSDMVIDFHGSGVIRDTPFDDKVLLDTRFPGTHTVGSAENPSKTDIEGGTYDGKSITLDKQPSDNVRGNRIEFELIDSEARGRNHAQVMVLGRSFDGVSSEGNLVAEFITFSENGSKLSQHYYREIVSVLFNNFSGGSGRTSNEASADSLDLISEGSGYMVIREAGPLKVYPASRSIFQIESPNIDMANFVTSSTSNTVQEEIELALGAGNSISDLYIELDGKEEITFPEDGESTISYGQKFLAHTNNIQRVDILLSVEQDLGKPIGSQFDFSGDLVISIHELSTEVDCPTDAAPDNLIDFDPEITPLVEMSFSQQDLEDLGYELDDVPRVVSFNFAGTLIADPNIDPSIRPNKYYAFIVKRSGDNRTGTIIMEKGFDKVTGKNEQGVGLSTVERFAKQQTKFIEFDPITKRYVTDSSSSLWFEVHSDAVEVTDGTAYSDTGVAITVPKTEGFVGETEISSFENNISLATVAEGSPNYVVLSHVDQFVDSDVHPRTGNHLFSRIINSASVSVVNQVGLDTLLENTIPLLLARVRDKNVRDAQAIEGSFDKPGYIDTNRVIIQNPSSSLLAANLINRIITPDIACDCNSNYRIVGVECITAKAGDLNGDGEITNADLGELVSLVGNTINSEVTERAILGGALDIIDFIKSDLNLDGSIDGTDIELLEDALDGYSNFTVAEETKFLILNLENILESDNFPTLFSDTAATGATTTGTDVVDLSTLTENEALAIRPGDSLVIPAPSVDAGTYTIVSKSVASDGLAVTFTVVAQDGSSASFVGTSGFDAVIISGTAVNTYADNPGLTSVPFSSFNYEISFIESPYEEDFLDVCDLRRFIEIGFVEEVGTDPCDCVEDDCLPTNDCAPEYKSQKYVPGDIYVPNGDILSAPGVPHHGDFEYANITIPLPAGTISDCSIDLYNTFVKAESGSCKTAAGFDALKFSDGTLVGCNDSGTNTDIAKGRVKFSHAICSLFVDALVDGYATDGYADASVAAEEQEVITENFIDDTFGAFDTWIENIGNDAAITNISHGVGPDEPAVFDITTIADPSEKFGRLDAPVAVQNFEDDFVLDLTVARTVWPETSTGGTVSSFATVVISNTDGSTSTLKYGWRKVENEPTKLFYSGVTEDAFTVVIGTFDFSINAPDDVGDEVLMRIRRVNDVVTALYLVPDKISETSPEAFGQYVRLGTNPALQPGSGPATLSFEVAQANTPTAGISYFVRLSEVIMRTEYSSSITPTDIPIARVAATGVIDRGTFSFPLNLISRTSIVSATIDLTAATAGTFADTINVIPVDVLNADNLGPIHNFPLTQDVSEIVSFAPGTVLVGDTISVDVTNTVRAMLGRTGHLPGYIKAFVFEPDSTSDFVFSVSVDATLTVAYEDISTGVVFKVGISLDKSTGIAVLNTRNVLFDALNQENRTLLNFGVYLKKSGFKNQDVEVSIDDLFRLGIGTCQDNSTLTSEDECFFVVGDTTVGTFVSGPFPCALG